MKKLFLAILALCSLSIFAEAQPRELVVYYFDRPPLYISTADSAPSGFICEIVDLILKETGLPYRWQEVPSSRVETLLRQQDYALAVGWYYKPERETWAQFSRPIYTDGPMVAVANSKNTKFASAQTIPELLKAPYKLGVINGFSYGTALDEAINSYNPKKEIVAGSQESLLSMTAAGRVDYMLLSIEEAVYLRGSNNEFAAKTYIVGLKDAAAGPDRFILASKSVPASVMELINKAVAKVRLSTAYQKILDKYLKY